MTESWALYPEWALCQSLHPGWTSLEVAGTVSYCWVSLNSSPIRANPTLKDPSPYLTLLNSSTNIHTSSRGPKAKAPGDTGHYEPATADAGCLSPRQDSKIRGDMGRGKGWEREGSGAPSAFTEEKGQSPGTTDKGSLRQVMSSERCLIKDNKPCLLEGQMKRSPRHFN